MNRNIKFRDVLRYLCHDGDNKECAVNIQVCFKDDEWDQFEEVNAASPMLKPFLDYEVICMDAEKSTLFKDNCCIRVSIQESAE